MNCINPLHKNKIENNAGTGWKREPNIIANLDNLYSEELKASIATMPHNTPISVGLPLKKPNKKG